MTTTFSNREYEAVIATTVKRIVELGRLKGGEYSGDDDRLLNFRRNGVNLGLPPEVVLMVYAGKHWDALMQYASDINSGKVRERLETIEGRIDDLILYLILYKCMFRERTRTVEG